MARSMETVPLNPSGHAPAVIHTQDLFAVHLLAIAAYVDGSCYRVRVGNMCMNASSWSDQNASGPHTERWKISRSITGTFTSTTGEPTQLHVGPTKGGDFYVTADIRDIDMTVAGKTRGEAIDEIHVLFVSLMEDHSHDIGENLCPGQSSRLAHLANATTGSLTRPNT
jgi:hypothetical protein